MSTAACCDGGGDASGGTMSCDATAVDAQSLVHAAYEAVAQKSASCCVTSVSNRASIGYDDADRAYVGDADLGVGCGTPVKFARLMRGECVVDLGCGAGVDVFLASRAVGTDGGRVVGVDMTNDMLKQARLKAKELNLRVPEDVDFKLGTLDALPVDNAIMDVVLSNCVINLCDDKRAAFEEAYRVLKPNGRIAIADVVNRGKALPKCMQTAEALVC